MDEITSLREALRLTPQNIPLRLIIARKLLQLKRYEEAETECKAALQYAPKETTILASLAESFYHQGKNSEAAVITEQLMDDDPTPPHELLHAQVLKKLGQLPEAKRFYRSAVEAEPTLESEELTRFFGLTPADFQNDSPDSFDKPMLEPVGGFFQEMSVVEPETPKINFERVGGMNGVKESIRMKIIYPLQNKEMFAAYGKKIGGGVLLYGPPGCGKTLLARATAGEIRAKFVAVGLHDILDMYIGNSEKQLHNIFETARENSPCVLFFDEVDALAAKRTDMRQSGSRHVINQFLSELDGSINENDGVLVIAATNAPWHVDSAFRRPGRFDRIQFVPPPDLNARTIIWQIHLNGKPVEKIDFAKLASASKGFSGADICAAVDSCVEETLSQAMKNGKMVPLSQNALLAAIKRTKLSTTEWFASAKNYATYANESGVYDEILEYLKNKKYD